MNAVNIGYLLILVALGLAAYLVIQYRVVKKVAHWPQADAVIESVRIRGSFP